MLTFVGFKVVTRKALQCSHLLDSNLEENKKYYCKDSAVLEILAKKMLVVGFYFLNQCVWGYTDPWPLLTSAKSGALRNEWVTDNH